MTKRSILKAVAVITLASFWIGIFVFFGFDTKAPHTTWHQLGSLQIIEGQAEVWLFVDIDKLSLNPEFGASPSKMHHVVRQYVFVITESGVKSEDMFESDFTFSSNVAVLFPFDDSFWLYDGDWEVPNRLYKLCPGGFSRIDGEEKSKILSSTGLNNATPSERIAITKRLLGTAGYKKLADEPHSHPGLDINAANGLLRIRSVEDKNSQSIVVESLAPEMPWSKVLVDVDVNRTLDK
jgi:hypothetical protein